MAQTTDGMSWVDGFVGLSDDGSSWTDFSGYANEVIVSGGERNTGAAFTMDGDTAIIKAGKRNPFTITINVVYTEVADMPFDTFMDAYETADGAAQYVRWSPAGGDSGDTGFTSSAGIVKQHAYPQGVTESGDPIMVSLVLECANITRAAIGTAGW